MEDIIKNKLEDAVTDGDLSTFLQVVGSYNFSASFSFSTHLLHTAIVTGRTAIVEEILKRCPSLVRTTNSQKQSPLHVAAEEGHIHICRKLVSLAPETILCRDLDGVNPIQIAAIRGRCEILQYFLDETDFASSIKVTLSRGRTVLHMCVIHNQLSTLKIVVESRFGKELLNATDDYGDTILHLAVRDIRVEIIRYLLDGNKITRLQRNSRGKTELDLINYWDARAIETKETKEIKGFLLKLLKDTRAIDSKEIKGLLLKLRKPLDDNIAPTILTRMLCAMILTHPVTAKPPGCVGWPKNYSCLMWYYVLIGFVIVWVSLIFLIVDYISSIFKYASCPFCKPKLVKDKRVHIKETRCCFHS